MAELRASAERDVAAFVIEFVRRIVDLHEAALKDVFGRKFEPSTFAADAQGLIRRVAAEAAQDVASPPPASPALTPPPQACSLGRCNSMRRTR
jgi:hypothetical protein